MDIGLCMIVKDEVERLADCLDPVVDLFSDSVSVDTGSCDGTPALLAVRYGITALSGALDAPHCNSKAPVRNQAHAAMLLACVLTRRGDTHDAAAIVARARHFHTRVADDFAVRINVRLRPWLETTAARLARGEFDLTPHAFAY